MTARNAWTQAFDREPVKPAGARVIHPLGHPSLDADTGKPVGRPKSTIPKADRAKASRDKRNAKRRDKCEAGMVYKESAGEFELTLQMKLAGLTGWAREYRFDPVRMWRIDFAWPQIRLAVEVDGGNWSGGRHVRGAGFAKDAEKQNAMTLAGWHLLRYTTEMVKTGVAVQQITDMLVGLQTVPANITQDAEIPRQALAGASQTGQKAVG